MDDSVQQQPVLTHECRLDEVLLNLLWRTQLNEGLTLQLMILKVLLMMLLLLHKLTLIPL